jgi:hypothetical protein
MGKNTDNIEKYNNYKQHDNRDKMYKNLNKEKLYFMHLVIRRFKNVSKIECLFKMPMFL